MQAFFHVISADQIALPDLAVAGMENWGLITYQEGGLLYDEEGSSLLQKQVVAILIAHELAHQVSVWLKNKNQSLHLRYISTV